MSKTDVGTMQLTATKNGSLALYEWRKAKGDAATLAVARGTMAAAVAMIATIEGEAKAFEYLQDISEEVIRPRLVHD